MSKDNMVLEESEDIEALEKLYDDAFPLSERRDLDLMHTLLFLERAHLLILKNLYGTPYDGEAPEDGENDFERAVCAFAYLYDGGEKVLLDYLAVNRIYRSLGVGTLMMEKLKEHYHEKKMIVAEIERCGGGIDENDNKIRQKRKEFYLNNGFVEAPISVALDGVRMEVLILPIEEDMLSVEDYLEIYNTAFGESFTAGYVEIEY